MNQVVMKNGHTSATSSDQRLGGNCYSLLEGTVIGLARLSLCKELTVMQSLAFKAQAEGKQPW